MSLQTTETQQPKKRGRPKGSFNKRTIVGDMLKKLDCEPVVKIVEQINKKGMPEAEINRLLIALLPYVHSRTPASHIRG